MMIFVVPFAALQEKAKILEKIYDLIYDTIEDWSSWMHRENHEKMSLKTEEPNTAVGSNKAQKCEEELDNSSPTTFITQGEPSLPYNITDISSHENLTESVTLSETANRKISYMLHLKSAKQLELESVVDF